MNLQQIIENHWYKKGNVLSTFCLNIFLLPFSYVFLIIIRVRMLLYKCGILKSFKLSVPVVIVGNITVGGSGKTPLTKHIARKLLEQNIKVGVILRGYKSKTVDAMIVKNGDDPEITGDEALIYASNNIPVAIGRNRYFAGLKLLKEYPDIDIILSDDGMQHYRLQRDFEIVVIDSTRILGNKYIIPNGPLREPISRLKKVNAIVVNTQNVIKDEWFLDNLGLKNSETQLRVSQKLVLDKIYTPVTGEQISINELKNKSVVAMAAIGNPHRFFRFIEDNGIKLNKTLSFPDHYYYHTHDIPAKYDIILTSDKDYTKLAKFNNKSIYVVNVTSSLNNNKLIHDISSFIHGEK